MKIFVAAEAEEGKISDTNYHWAKNGELLMFGQFQTEEGRSDEISMCGVETRKFTTHIIVKDMDIDREFFKGLIVESVERSMKCKIMEDGKYKVDIAFGFVFDIEQIIDELIKKANQFEDGQEVKYYGRTITAI